MKNKLQETLLDIFWNGLDNLMGLFFLSMPANHCLI